MIRPIDIRLNAAHPELPLAEAVTFTGSPSTVLIRGVPPNCGRWAITAVFVAASFPDGSTTTRAAVQSANGVWVATLPATATSGRTANGIRIMADGVDENGEAVTGYILGVADFAVASLDVTPAPEPGETSYQLLYFDTVPSVLHKGDVTKIDGVLKFYDGTAWQPFADLSNYYTAEQVDEAIDKLAAYYITADANGNPFATHAALVNAQTYYSGGSVRTPTRNDYAVVSADETHGGAEWRYIYAVDAQGVGQWEPQYAVGGVIAYDNTVTPTSANGVKSSGIWSAIWGALSALPTGFASLYDWCVSQLAGKLDAAESVEYAALVALRNGGNLVPGQQYRITNYVATVANDTNAQSANHPFDIVVTADDEHTLNEHARAIRHDGDTYFAGCNLAAWDVWYCLDNDATRFGWADSTNGKGVIYRLVDEFQNDVPYDFKGIQFKAYGDTDNVWRYTFDSGAASGNTDYSLTGLTRSVYKNTIAEYTYIYQRLHCIVFKGAYCYNNTFGVNCYNNTFGAYCYDNTFGAYCYNNTFGAYCYDNTFVVNCYNNTFGANCYDNTFDADCYDNTFDAYCSYNTFVADCQYNTFGTGCQYNTFGMYCSYNKFVADCSYNTFGMYCSYNKFVADCSYNTFGTYSYNNTFGTHCYNNTFGTHCFFIKFGTASTLKSYCRYVRVAAGNRRLHINPTGTTSGSAYYQNVEIKEGVNNTNTYKTIDDPNVGQTFHTTYKPADSKEISL